MLWRMHVRGWRFSRTRLSDRCGYAEFRADRPEGAVEIMLLKQGRDADFGDARSELAAEAGDVIVCFAPERDTTVGKADEQTAAS
ncbi:MAG: hypothetical protein ACREQZ_01305 [Woeseiaceae bacterium]